MGQFFLHILFKFKLMLTVIIFINPPAFIILDLNKEVKSITIMNSQTLQKLQVKDLEHYRDTLLKRIQQLKRFNIELGKENVDLAARLNQVKIQAHELQKAKDRKKVKANNFDFDDLYRLGKDKVGKIATKQNITSLISSGGKKISKGFGFATDYVKNYIYHKKKTSTEEKEQDVNKDADFNSYDIQPPKQFQIKSQKPLQKQYNPPVNETITSSVRRRNIFQKQTNQQQSQTSEKKNQDSQKQPNKMQREKIENERNQPSDDQYAIKDDEEDPKEGEKSKQTPEKNEKNKEGSKKSGDKSERSFDLKQESKMSNQSQKSQKSQKEVEVAPNEIVDLQNSQDEEESISEQNPKKEKAEQKGSPKKN